MGIKKKTTTAEVRMTEKEHKLLNTQLFKYLNLAKH